MIQKLVFLLRVPSAEKLQHYYFLIRIARKMQIEDTILVSSIVRVAQFFKLKSN